MLWTTIHGCYGQPSMVVHGDSFFFFWVFSSIDKIPPQQPVQSVVVWKINDTNQYTLLKDQDGKGKSNFRCDLWTWWFRSYFKSWITQFPNRKFSSPQFPQQAADRWMVKFTNPCLTFFDPYSKIISCVMGFPLGPRHWIIEKLTTHQFRFFSSVVSMTVKSRNDAQAGKMLRFKSVILQRDARRPAMDDVHQLSIHKLLLGRGFKYVFSPLSLGKWWNLTIWYFLNGLVKPPTSSFFLKAWVTIFSYWILGTRSLHFKMVVSVRWLQIIT